jgi:tripartite-type tricarboxylate transporter receptor subunit TctC
LLLVGAIGPTLADPIADFYKGKNLTINVGYSPGGDYDLRSRLIAKYMSKHIPGNPQIIVRNMTGGGGLVVTNWLANIAQRDGTVMMVMPQAMPVMQAMGVKGVKFDVRKFNWLGNSSTSPNVINSWHSTGIKSLEDARKRELILGSTGRGNGTYNYPAAMNMFAGTKFKIVGGYRGGANMNLAMEKGETGGRGSNSWASWKSTKPQWLKEKKVYMIVQVAMKRHPDLPDVPTMLESTNDPKGKDLMTFLSLDIAISRAYVTTEGVPKERVAALRKAFEATMVDKEFLAGAAKTKMDISPSSADEARSAATQIVNTKPETLALARQLLEVKK